MKLSTTFAALVAALTIGVTGAGADPDGYQPQLREGVPSDAFDRYLLNNAPAAPPDAFDRYLRNHSTSAQGASGAASHPDSQAVRPGAVAQTEPIADDELGFSWESGVVGALGAAFVLVLALAGAFAMRERRRLVLR